MTPEQIMGSIDSLNRLYRSYTDTNKQKEAEKVSVKILELMALLK